MAYLQPNDPSEKGNFTTNYWMLSSGPFGVSGFCMDGVEMGSYCYLCDTRTTASQSRAHFEGKKHVQKVKSVRQGKTKFIIEPSTGGDMDDPDNLFLPDCCKVCNAELSTPEQQEGHYMSEKHQKKVRNYFYVKIGIREKTTKIDEELDEEELKKKSKLEYCATCKIELSAPVVAQAHYTGKKHAKKLREKMGSETDGEKWHKCDICDIRLKSDSQFTQHLQTPKHLAQMEKMGSECVEETRKSVTKRKEEIEIMLKEEDAKRACLAQELDEIKKGLVLQKWMEIMTRPNDHGYQSSDNNESEPRMGDIEENIIFQDLNYNVAERRLEEPNYIALRERRFERNQNAMKTLDAHITAPLMPYTGNPEIRTAQENAAVVIQKHVRGFLAQRKYVDLLMAQFEKDEKLRRQKTIEQMEEAKLLIENHQLGHQLEVEFEEYNVVRKNKVQRLIYCAITIQRAWRNYLTMKKAQLYTEDKIWWQRVNDDNELDLAVQLN